VSDYFTPNPQAADSGEALLVLRSRGPLACDVTDSIVAELAASPEKLARAVAEAGNGWMTELRAEVAVKLLRERLGDSVRMLGTHFLNDLAQAMMSYPEVDIVVSFRRRPPQNVMGASSVGGVVP
jgi:hypothetical protein